MLCILTLRCTASLLRLHHHGDPYLQGSPLFLMWRGYLLAALIHQYEYSVLSVFISGCTILEYTYQYDYSLPTVFIPDCTVLDPHIL
jgi:hypothetical protein